MQESPHEREGIDNASRVTFRGLTGVLALVAFLWIAAELLEPVSRMLRRDRFMTPSSMILMVAPLAGWSGLFYASGRITDTALAFVWALGICGMAISYFTIGFPFDWAGTVMLIGIWILNGLGIVWIVQKVRRIRAASNTDAADAAESGKA